MHNQTTLAKHAALVDAMSERLGVDLEEATLRGQLDFAEIADAVLRCTGCTGVEDCQSLLAHDTGKDIPGYCRNAGMFRELGVGA